MNIHAFSDQKLYNLCREYGALALKARNRFIGLLPEVNARKLYEKKFSSIFHFAAIVAGVSREQVSRAISLAEKFADMPHLFGLLVNGIVSVNKLRKVVSIATIENEVELANLVQTLSKAALETLVRDIQIEKVQNRESATVLGELKIKTGLFEIKNAEISGPGTRSIYPMATTEPFEYVSNPPLNNQVKRKLNELAEKHIDINQFIEEALIRREQEIAKEKQTLAEKAEQKVIEQMTEQKVVSTYIPVATRRLFKKEFGTKCAKPFCKNDAQEIHHTNRFSISGIHDPRYMAPLCKNHHQIAHSIDANVTVKRWKL